MLVNLKLKLPNFDIIDVHIMVVPSTRIADIVDSIRQDPRFNYLEGSHLRFIHKYMELDAEACFVDCAISNGDTIELVVKMAEDLLVSREVEYRHFLRSSSPCDGETGVSVNVVINIVFGPSKRGLVVHIPSLLSFEALLPAVYHYGDMEAALGPHMARHKGLGPLWTRHVFHNRILLLELKSKNSAEDNEFRDHVEKVGYSWRGVNDGYFEGDVHSWQRYTTELPIECRVGSTTAGMGVDECSVTVQPHFRLKYGTYYAIYLGNNVPTVPSASSASPFYGFTGPGMCEDKLIIFRTISQAEEEMRIKKTVRKKSPTKRSSPSRRSPSPVSGGTKSPSPHRMS